MGTNRRLKGEGSWGTKTVSGKTYVRYRKVYMEKLKSFMVQLKPQQPLSHLQL